MDPTALYYALSTIAQCAAALAALIGFLGLWRLDRLRDEAPQIVQRMNQLLTAMQHGGDAVIRPEHDRLDARLKALPGEQCRLLWALRIFLVVTLIILGAAVVGFLYVDQAKAWVWTPWLLWIAGSWLAVGPIIVVLTAARLPRAIVALALLLALGTPAWAGPVPSTEPTALYYALSTIAQCAAALAALIGFLGLWRLDRLRDEEHQAEDEVIAGVLRICNRGADNIPVFGRVFLLQIAHKLVAEPTPIIENGSEIHHLPTSEQIIKSTLRPTLRRYDALPDERQRLMGTLSRFLPRTLVILALAISGLVVADVLYFWVLTRWLTGLLIIFAAYRLWRDTYAVVREAARSARTLVILALVLLASPALAGPVRCTTYEEKTLGRLQTLCDDGTRAVSTWSPTLQHWDTTVTPAPGKTCTGQLNPKTLLWEGRCR